MNVQVDGEDELNLIKDATADEMPATNVGK